MPKNLRDCSRGPVQYKPKHETKQFYPPVTFPNMKNYQHNNNTTDVSKNPNENKVQERLLRYQCNVLKYYEIQKAFSTQP